MLASRTQGLRSNPVCHRMNPFAFIWIAMGIYEYTPSQTWTYLLLRVK